MRNHMRSYATFPTGTPPTSQKPDHETHHPPYETFNIARKATRTMTNEQQQMNNDDSEQTETNSKNLTSHLDNFVC